MPTGCESWPITVTLLAASGKGECREHGLGRNDRVSPIHMKNRLVLPNQRDCQTARPLNYENRGEIVVYQQNAATIFRGKRTIFELTDMVKTASCRAYPEKLSGL
jgi:hypothetical protein